MIPSNLSTYVGFALLGLANTVVPFIVFSANYLIIPYPRWVVVLIETLPALFAKLLLPHVLHRVPYWMRPLSAAACWILVAALTKAAPPNVAPPLRVLTSVLASSSAAAMDVSFLGMTRYYGRAGLAGWGAGVGAGALFCAVLPFVLTVWMEAFLRSFIDCIYALAGTLLFAFFVLLPGAPVNYPDTRRRKDVEDALVYDPLEELSRLLSLDNRLDLVQSMVRPLMMPLFTAFATQAIVFPGIARALPASPAFDGFFSFLATYGFAFQLGGFTSRALTPLLRPKSTRLAFVVLNLAAVALLADTTFSLFSSPVLVCLLVWCAGVAGGAVYMIVLGQVLEEKAAEPGVNQEFCLQVVGAGETGGLLVGGLLGAALEGSLCGEVSGRWCRRR